MFVKDAAPNHNSLLEDSNEEYVGQMQSTKTVTNIHFYTIDDALSHMGVGCFQYRMIFITGFMYAADAMEMMLLSFVIPLLKKDWSLKPPTDGLIGAIVFAGLLIGTAFYSIISDKYGRRKVVIFSSFGCALFGFISAVVPNIYFMLAARFMVGFSIGGGPTSYTLFAEYAPKEVRGRLLILQQSFWSFGALFSALLAYVSLSLLNWRWYLIFSSIPILMVALCSKWLPESVRWLIACGRVKDAQKVLERIARINGKSLPNGVLRATNSITVRGRLCDVFVLKYRLASVQLYVIMLMCEFGYYGISFISERFFNQVSGNLSAYLEMIITTSSEVPALIVGYILLDRIGRKKTLYFVLGIYALCCYLMAMPIVESSMIGSMSCVFIGRMNIALGFMVLFIYFSEYYPTTVRVTAVGCAASIGRIGGMAASFVSEDVSIYVAMLVFGTAGLIAFVCAFTLQRDTTGLELVSTIDCKIQTDTPDVSKHKLRKHEFWMMNHVRQ